MSKLSVIYKIVSITNGKIYIGSSNDYASRKNLHLRQLKNSKHPNQLIQNHYNKYGIEDLVFAIVEDVELPSDLLKREQFYINTLAPEFNICKIAGSHLGLKRSDVTKNKMRKPKNGGVKVLRGPQSDAHRNNIAKGKKGYRHSEEAVRKMRVSFIDKDFKTKKHVDYIKSNIGHKSQIEMAAEINVNQSSISRVVKKMKVALSILLILVSFGLKAQTPLPAGLPFPKAPTAWYDIGWMQTDSGFINAVRSTSFTPRFVGTQVFQIRAGVDTLPWWWTGQRWITFPTTGGGGGNFNSFSFTNQNGITGVVTGATGPNVALALGTNLNGIVKGNGSGFGTVVVGSGLTYDGTTLSAGTNINALISGNGTNFIATTIGAGLSYSTITHTLSNTIVNNNQLINGAGYITNITGLVTAGTNISITGNGTSGNPYVINSSGGGGSVTGAGNLSPLFTTSTSAGTINFAFQNPVAFRIFGNPTNATAAPIYFGTDATLIFSGNLLGVNPAAPLNFYQTITQIDSFTFTLNTPTGRHDTVRISLPTNGFVSILQNGLNLTGSIGEMGGPLLHNTLINGGGFSLGIQGNRFATGMGADIVAANNLTTGNDGNLFHVTGLTQINALTTTNWQNGAEISFIFTSTPVLKNNTVGGGGTAPMQLAGSIDYQAAPGDYIKFQYDGSFWHEVTRKLTSAGGAYIFSNGITESPATRVKLGGTLTQNTTLAGASTFWFAISNGRFQTGAGAAIVAANNLLPGNDGNQFSVTGNTQINAISTLNWQAGPHIELIFTGTPLLKQNTVGGVNTAPMLLAGSVDYQAAAGDLIGFSYDGTVWHETNRKLAGSVTNLTFNNGLTQTSTLVQLGGSLVQTTTINTSTFGLSVNGAVTGGGAPLNAQNSAGPGFIAIGTTNSTAGAVLINFGTGSGVTATTNGGSAFNGQTTDNTNVNTVIPVLQLRRHTALGAATSGIGGSIEFYNATVATSLLSNSIISKWTDPVDATRTSQFILTGFGNASPTTLITFNGNGQGIMSNTVPSADLFSVTNTEPTLTNTAIRGVSTNGAGIVGSSTSGNGIIGTSVNGFGGQFSSTNSNGISVVSNSSSSVAGAFTLVPATTNTVRSVATFLRNTSGTAANGIGSGIDLVSRTTTGGTGGNTLISTLTDATGAAPTSQFSIQGQLTSVSLTTLWTLDGNGNITTTGGYIDNIVNTAAGTYTILANDLTVIFTGTTSTFTFPTAVKGRRLNLINNGSGSITYGTAITTANGVTTTTSVAGNRDQVQNDGTVWRKIN